eukprot:gene14823-biopygen17131
MPLDRVPFPRHPQVTETPVTYRKVRKRARQHCMKHWEYPPVPTHTACRVSLHCMPRTPLAMLSACLPACLSPRARGHACMYVCCCVPLNLHRCS